MPPHILFITPHILSIQPLTLLIPTTPTQILLLQIDRNVIESSTTPLGLIRYFFRMVGLKHRVIGRML